MIRGGCDIEKMDKDPLGASWRSRVFKQESSENDLGQPSFWVYEGIRQIEEVEKV